MTERNAERAKGSPVKGRCKKESVGGTGKGGIAMKGRGE